MYWLISDTHFGHSKLVACGGRPADFERRLEANLLRCARAGDTLIHLGDVALSAAGYERWESISERLGSRKLLIRGNHDEKSAAFYTQTGWYCVAEGLILSVFGKRVVFTHEPLLTVDPWDLNIHGHIHEGVHRAGEIAEGKHILISAERLQYQPIPLHAVVKLGATPAFVEGRFRTCGTTVPSGGARGQTSP